jgi:hypothetical protein
MSETISAAFVRADDPVLIERLDGRNGRGYA